MTDADSAFDIVAATCAALVTSTDGTEILNVLITDCLAPLGAQAAAILVTSATGELRVSCASAHRTVEIEMLQAQHSAGPCVDAIEAGTIVLASGHDEFVARWDGVGEAISSAGYLTVAAVPLAWNRTIIGGLNIFWTTAIEPDEEALQIARAMADLASTTIMRDTSLTSSQVDARVQKTLTARSRIEQAKGVLSYLEGISIDEAHQLLIDRAQANNQSLLEFASMVIDEQINQR